MRALANQDPIIQKKYTTPRIHRQIQIKQEWDFFLCPVLAGVWENGYTHTLANITFQENLSSLVNLKIVIPIGKIIPGVITCSFTKLKTTQTCIYTGSIKQIRVHLLIQQNVDCLPSDEAFILVGRTAQQISKQIAIHGLGSMF